MKQIRLPFTVFTLCDPLFPFAVFNMEQRLRSIASDLRKIGSEQAASWLMDHYPEGKANWGEAVTLIGHLSWKKPDQMRLARHYLRGLPHASPSAYEVFASFMQISTLVAIMKEYVPSDRSRRDLLAYYVGPVLMRAASTAQDRYAVENFLAEIKQE